MAGKVRQIDVLAPEAVRGGACDAVGAFGQLAHGVPPRGVAVEAGLAVARVGGAFEGH